MSSHTHYPCPAHKHLDKERESDGGTARMLVKKARRGYPKHWRGSQTRASVSEKSAGVGDAPRELNKKEQEKK